MSLSTQPILTAVFKAHLKQAGFDIEHLELCYSLSHCQGDGAAFYGAVEFSRLPTLFRKMYNEEKVAQHGVAFEALIKNLGKVESYFSQIEIRRNHHLYCHSGTMRFHYPYDRGLNFFCNEYTEEWAEMPLSKEECGVLWNTFVVDFQKYCEEVVNGFVSKGYRILAAIPYRDEVVCQFQTQHFRMEITAQPLSDYALDLDDEEDILLLGEMLLSEGEARLADILVEIKDRESNTILGSCYYPAVQFEKNDRGVGGVRDEMVAEAIYQARKSISAIQKRFASIKPI